MRGRLSRALQQRSPNPAPSCFPSRCRPPRTHPLPAGPGRAEGWQPRTPGALSRRRRASGSAAAGTRARVGDDGGEGMGTGRTKKGGKPRDAVVLRLGSPQKAQERGKRPERGPASAWARPAPPGTCCCCAGSPTWVCAVGPSARCPALVSPSKAARRVEVSCQSFEMRSIR